MLDYGQLIAKENQLAYQFVANLLALIQEGATLPFIARYRKDSTGGMDEDQIRSVAERYLYLTELDGRKETILRAIEKQEQLTDLLKNKIDACLDKVELEDLYLPYKVKRKTRAMAAKEKGLDLFLADVLQQRAVLSSLVPLSQSFLAKNPDLKDEEEVLAGASDIYAESIAENATYRAMLREELMEKGSFSVKVKSKFKDQQTKFNMYYDFQRAVKAIPSHNLLAIRRGEKEGVLTFTIECDDEAFLQQVFQRELRNCTECVSTFLKTSITDAYQRLLKRSIVAELRVHTKKVADLGAIAVFESNLKELMLAPPAGNYSVIGIDPGFRSGCKLVVLNETGKLLDHKTIYPNEPQKQVDKAEQVLLSVVKNTGPKYIAVGNGTASRETLVFVKNALKTLVSEEKPQPLLVSESGASVYSASPIAKKEFPELDVTVRGAVSIARRLQDPLAELVKIDPKSIGVGQYQHDVDQKLLREKLADVVESCVNYVGVDINSASAELLSFVSGVTTKTAQNILNFRDQNGVFGSRMELKKVAGVGEKVFEQAAGFLRIKNGKFPLDDTAVHPESYYVVEKIAQTCSLSLPELLKNKQVLVQLDIARFTDEKVGVLALQDIMEELRKPGRDPRDQFSYANFRDDVTTIADLKEGMVLEGVVSNVAQFGAFVDIGVHQDGLVHVSQLSNQFVKDPNKVVRVGQRVKVRIISVEPELKRISLSMKEIDASGGRSETPAKKKEPKKNEPKNHSLNDLMNKWGR